MALDSLFKVANPDRISADHAPCRRATGPAPGTPAAGIAAT